MMGGWMYGMGGGWLWLLLLVVVVVIGVIMFRGGWSSGSSSGRSALPPQSTPGQATDILKERYARGEISRQEYDEMRRTLER
jgi:putative membrane protein